MTCGPINQKSLIQMRLNAPPVVITKSGFANFLIASPTRAPNEPRRVPATTARSLAPKLAPARVGRC